VLTSPAFSAFFACVDKNRLMFQKKWVLGRAMLVVTFGVTPPGREKISIWYPLSLVLLLDLFLAMHGCEERYLIVACTIITDVPEAVGP
jgi:hypothetical protein